MNLTISLQLNILFHLLNHVLIFLKPFSLQIISGLQNFDKENVASVVTAADKVVCFHSLSICGLSMKPNLVVNQIRFSDLVICFEHCMNQTTTTLLNVDLNEEKNLPFPDVGSFAREMTCADIGNEK